jgi:hypothetical protein
MIKRDNPSGYFQTFDGRGVKVEGETRQCGHCQFIWEYKPGSGRRYGLCTSCNCLTCGREECRMDQLEKRAIIWHEDGKSYDCVPFEEWNYRLMNKAAHTAGKIGQDFAMNDSGLIIPRPDNV